MTKGLHVPSEIGKLRKVCLHRPGDELLNLPPDELERLLFDDVPFLEVAQQEHDTFAQILRDQGVEVLYLENLVAEVFDQVPGARAEFTDQYIAEAGIRGQHMPQIVREKLDSIEDNLEFVKKTMAGMTKAEIDMPLTASTTLDSLVNSESESDLIIDPMPNLYFTRDPFATIGTGVSIHKMHTVTRNRETLFGRFIFEHNPWYQNAPRWYDRSASSSLEGGDILVLSPQVLAVGISQRTEGDSIDQLAQTVLSQSKTFQKVLAFNIPKSRSFMHLDTVFTMVDRDKFTVHPNILSDITVFVMELGENQQMQIRQETGRLEDILKEHLGLSQVTLIPCGQGSVIDAAREQWSDGSNTLAIAPGEVVVYTRNHVTNRSLEEAGIRIHAIPSAELSRGRGGPRCMSMPLIRDDP